jgi:hypothetical protein
LKIYYYLLLYFVITMALQGRSPLGLALYESAYISMIKVVEAPVPKVGYKIPTGMLGELWNIVLMEMEANLRRNMWK